jgi:hypothetical protein
VCGAFPKNFRRIESKVARCEKSLVETAFFHFKIRDLRLDKRAKYPMRSNGPPCIWGRNDPMRLRKWTAAFAAVRSLGCGAALAQDYPVKSVRA